MTTCLRLMILGLVAAIAGGCSAQKTGTQTRTIEDAQWGIPGTVVTMPVGWKFDGLVSHGESCVSTEPGMRWAAESPDGSIEEQHYPEIRYSSTNSQQGNTQAQRQGCLVTQYVKPEDFLTHVVAATLHPGAQTEVRPWPGGAEQDKGRAMLQQQDQQQMAQIRGLTAHTDVNSYELIMHFTRGNVSMSEAFIAEFLCKSTRMAVMNYQTVECSINDGTTVRAPSAQFQSLVSAVPVHAHRTREWEDRSAKFVQARFAEQNAQQQARINNDRQNQIAQNNALMDRQRAQYEAGMQRAQASSDTRHAGDVAFSNHLADQNTYRDPSSGKSYQVSNQYSHTYLDSTGHTILQTNSAYSPGPDTVWQELQPHN